jgi:hypothetical protein
MNSNTCSKAKAKSVALVSKKRKSNQYQKLGDATKLPSSSGTPTQHHKKKSSPVDGGAHNKSKLNQEDATKVPSSSGTHVQHYKKRSFPVIIIINLTKYL